MSDKYFNIEELEQKRFEAIKNLETIDKQLAQAKTEEEKVKQEKLRAEKEVRQKELNEAFEKYYELKKAFIKDYNYYSTSTSESFKDMDATIKALARFWWF